MKTAVLKDEQLDYWVAKAEKVYEQYVASREDMGDPISIGSLEDWISYTCYSPSTDWSQGGPIIERERIGFVVKPTFRGGGVFAAYPCKKGEWGSSYLIAAMRCFVASKFGEEVL